MDKKLIYEGKAKKVYEIEGKNEIIIYYKDDATAFNNKKRGSILNKGIINSEISTDIYRYLIKNGIKTHFIDKLTDREQLCKRVSIIPLEVIVRNILAGSTAKLLGKEEGLRLDKEIVEICYKNDELGDPLINDFHAIALGIVTKEELEKIYEEALKINELLKALFKKMGIELVDFKIEFGKDSNGDIILADEISPDCCRLWDSVTNKKLDKDRFRRDLGEVEESYIEVLERLKRVEK